MISKQNYSHFTVSTPLEEERCLVLGFLGGRQRWDSEREGVRQLALKLRSRSLPVSVETVENSRRDLAIRLIESAFDRNRDGRLDDAEKRRVRLIIYGQSFGGAAVVKLARQLNEMRVPALLTIQIDSVGRNDGLIPPNVRRAANLYQRNGWFIRGEAEIRAEDAARTEILGNFLFDYRNREIDLAGVSWHKLIFRKAHAMMNRDPRVWAKVEELIVAECGGRSQSAPR